MAPALTFAKGSLGTPGAQRSTGLSTIRIVNIVTVAFAAVVLLAVLVTR
jgi:hypothetical protein